MKKTRGLWISVILVAVLVVVAVVGFAVGSLKPVLGLDLEGGVSVILSAPEGTPRDVMEQALENIRNRVDAFGVGEPDIVLAGNTIEIQIPGLTNSTVQQRSADVYCIEDPTKTGYGCSADQAAVQEARDGLQVTSEPTKVCLSTTDADPLQCYASTAEANAAKAGITVQPKQSASATPSASASGTPSASPTAGPPPQASSYCLTDFAQNELHCYPTQAQAEAARKAITSKTTETTWCIEPAAPPATNPSATPTPTTSASIEPSGSASVTPGASASPDAGAAFEQLDRTGAKPLPCDFATRQTAAAALDGFTVNHVTTQYCVVSSQDEDLGCFTTTAAAAERQRETGQQHLLDIIGKTARLEERATIEIVPPSDPRYNSIQLTCQTPAEQASKSCLGAAQDGNEVWYPDKGTTPDKVHLGPVIITGSDITKASAQLTSDPNTGVTEWVVTFDLNGSGSKAFEAATRAALNAPPPQNQIAIAVDRSIISNPQVNGVITGSGQITGNFTEQDAKDLATVLNAGALPVELTRQSVQTVSPTLGAQSLRQGIIAGIAGLVLLFLYLLFYYRLLGIVAWVGMTIWALLALALVSIAGKSFGYALSLAGVAGLVISLGVTADSYIVFFERLKDEVRSGRSPRTVVQPAFKRAFRTIVAADIVTGIAAAVLYLTAVSSVRGFALTLGVATLLDLFVVYFFKRPTVYLIARNPKLVEMPGFGLGSATAGDHTAIDTSGEPTS
jgi:protein-export membrane protein SecD